MKALRTVFMSLVMLLLYAPIFVMIVFSFNSAKSTSIFKGFSVRWYKELFLYNSNLIDALKNTLLLAVISAVIATVLGTVAAVGIAKMRKKWLKSAVMTATNIPMMNPDVVTGISMMLMFVSVGKLLSLTSSVNFFTILFDDFFNENMKLFTFEGCFISFRIFLTHFKENIRTGALHSFRNLIRHLGSRSTFLLRVLKYMHLVEVYSFQILYCFSKFFLCFSSEANDYIGCKSRSVEVATDSVAGFDKFFNGIFTVHSF